MTTFRHCGRFLLALIVASATLAACGGGGGGGGGGNNPPPNLVITTTTLSSGNIGSLYNQTVVATGGTGARTFTVTAGALPAGLTLAAGGVISGTPTGPVATSNFTVTVTDAGSPVQTDTQALSIVIGAASIGRNDTIATATALTNGSFAASISPSGHPNTSFTPDEDYYEITTTAASTVTVDINAQVNGSPIDSVIEIVGANGVPLGTCLAPGFSSTCIHDDEDPGNDLDSFLQIQVAGATTFYVHVVEWRGDARPDLTYTIVISGIN